MGFTTMPFVRKNFTHPLSWLLDVVDRLFQPLNFFLKFGLVCVCTRSLLQLVDFCFELFHDRLGIPSPSPTPTVKPCIVWIQVF